MGFRLFASIVTTKGAQDRMRSPRPKEAHGHEGRHADNRDTFYDYEILRAIQHHANSSQKVQRHYGDEQNGISLHPRLAPAPIADERAVAPQR